jgi:tRNA (cytidine56-2'-O)-methyltransferase
MELVEVWVLRLSHRVARDVRVTSHVALTARAFGARGMYFSGDFDENIIKTIRKVTSLWGGEFEVQYIENPLRFAKEWKSSGEVIHLTMYGLPIKDVIGEVRKSIRRKLVVVGSKKVPHEMYLIADWNISITNQPHSEVSALAIFLHELFEGYELNLNFKNAKLKVIPQPRGKKIIKQHS